jgi:transposase
VTAWELLLQQHRLCKKEEVLNLLRGGEVSEIKELKRLGMSIQAIGGLTGHDRKTIRKYLGSEPGTTPRYGPRAPRPSKLDPFKPYLEERRQAGVWNAVVLLRELRERGYSGGYTIVKDYLQPHREAAHQVAVRRFETAPGVQAQVDWGHLGYVEEDAQACPISGFVFTLGYSRALMAEAAVDQRLGTLLRLHEEAFRQLGGVPREILYDRMKTVWLGMDERGEIQWHPQFLDFARYWGFTPRLCPAYRAQTKGKVESGVRYVRRNFLCSLQGREPHSVDELNAALRSWVWEIANQRVHGTTHCLVKERWEAEKAELQPLLGRAPYPFVEEELRRVSRDAYVAWQGNRYSVPWRYAGQQVRVRGKAAVVEVYAGSQRIAVHHLLVGKHQLASLSEHHAGIPLGRLRPPAKAQVRLRRLGPEVEVRSLAAYDYVAAGGAR